MGGGVTGRGAGETDVNREMQPKPKVLRASSMEEAPRVLESPRSPLPGHQPLAQTPEQRSTFE